MRRVLLIDTETSGLDPKVDVCIEVAAVVYDLQHASPIVSFAALIHSTANPCEKVNHIPAALLGEAPPSDLIWPRVASMVDVCDAILAHNAPFDRSFVPEPLRTAKPWICTQNDLDWPQQTKPGQSLVNLALAHGLGVASAHRALNDCDLLARLLTRVAEQGTELVPFLERGLRPKATYQALVSFHDNHKAKAAGFQWEPESKRWLRTLAVEDACNFPFLIRQVAA